MLGLEVPRLVQTVNQGQLLLVLGLGPLSKRCLLRPDSSCLRGFRKNRKYEQRQTFPVEKPLETAWVALKIGCTACQGIARVMES